MIESQCMLVCRQCSPTGDLPMPFVSRVERGKWAALHTKGTGHADWYCLDGWPTPQEVVELLAAHDRRAQELRVLIRGIEETA